MNICYLGSTILEGRRESMPDWQETHHQSRCLPWKAVHPWNANEDTTPSQFPRDAAVAITGKLPMNVRLFIDSACNSEALRRLNIPGRSCYSLHRLFSCA